MGFEENSPALRRLTLSNVRTCVRGSLLEADVTHPDGAETPASLGDGRRLGRAAIAEALPAGTAVMFGVVVLEDCVTFVAHLGHKRQNNN